MQPIWNPSQKLIDTSNLTAFIKKVNAYFGPSIRSYQELYQTNACFLMQLCGVVSVILWSLLCNQLI